MEQQNKVSKIYCIKSDQTDKIYIGSTTQRLCKRLQNHKSAYKTYLDRVMKYTSSFEIVKYDDAYIEVISEHENISKDMLFRYEGIEIKKHNNSVNKRIEGRTIKEYLIDYKKKLKVNSKQYYIDNKEKIEVNRKQYYIDNKEKIDLNCKQYYVDNKEKIDLNCKQYYVDNKAKIRARLSQYYTDKKERLYENHTCECGGKYSFTHKSRHFKSAKHLKFIE